MKNWLRRWLGITALEVAAVEQGAALQDDLNATADQVVKNNASIAGHNDLLTTHSSQLLQLAQQLNRNTTTIVRWATQSATLQALEAKHRAELRKAQLKAHLEREAAATTPAGEVKAEP